MADKQSLLANNFIFCLSNIFLFLYGSQIKVCSNHFFKFEQIKASVQFIFHHLFIGSYSSFKEFVKYESYSTNNMSRIYNNILANNALKESNISIYL